MTLRRLLLDTRGAGAAEFAMVVPLLALFMLGIIDAGRMMWELNEVKKAAAQGVRFAIVTDPVEGKLASADYVGKTVGGVTLTQGDRIPAAGLGKVVCDDTSCTCTGTCSPLGGTTYSSAAFNAIVARMRLHYPQIAADNVTVTYSGSGLGYAGNPGGPDISPLVTVTVSGLEFQPVTAMLLTSFTLPTERASLTAEDISGTQSH
ncbi:TadE/TadG family type IV pilus assembly protein [Sphingomicrobium nitratireducens]|uniref:TadE/TadG family type IV pilus assembly protein n=1 Tax=Sphingomicrobium nitratireducens TaxID=2964666 RepID=UPI00224019EA|nr:TadE/TadG family type IV pilus assembly protein [Sphingomicrobium nitratireducens]